MFRQRVVMVYEGSHRVVRTVTATPTAVVYSHNGDLIGLKAVPSGTVRERLYPVAGVRRFADDDLARLSPADAMERLDIEADEEWTGEPIDPARRRSFLRERGTGISRTRGRPLRSLPEGVVRMVYTHGINRRRTKDVIIRAFRPRRDDVVVIDLSNGVVQALKLAAILTLIDPVSDRRLDDEGAIREFVASHGPRPLWQRLVGSWTRQWDAILT
ncbi:hypothetical protein [Acuticoccus sp.]|uniref:hypothetical protein n=1 Tax=Acuticoccus sp. TaxID=1904378 RepID=UPI003B526D74